MKPQRAQPEVTTMPTPAQVLVIPTSQVLVRFFDGKDGINTDTIQATRLNWLLGYFQNWDVSSVREAVKSYKEAHKADGNKTAQVRGSEIYALYGAIRFAAMQLERTAYHAAVSQARAVLKAKGIRWTGDHVPTKDEREAKQEATKTAQLEYAVAFERGLAQRTGREFTDTDEAQLRAKTETMIERADATKFAGEIIRRYGVEYAGQLVDSLQSAIASAEQEAKNKAETVRTGTEG